MFAMAAGDGHGGAAGMAGLSADSLEQQRPAGDGFAMMIGVGQASEQIPPIAHQRDAARHQAAALEIASREAAPAPLVFQFVEAVLAIGTVAIELAEGQDFAAQRGDQNGVLPKLASPRSSHGRSSAGSRSSSAHNPGVECLEVCWFPGATSTASTSRRLAST